MNTHKEFKTISELFHSIGGRAAFAMHMRQAGFPVYSALLANWEKTNRIPLAWKVGIEKTAERFSMIPEYAQMNNFMVANSTRNPHAPSSYTEVPLYQFMRAKFGSVDKFIASVREKQDWKVQRNDVYSWFKCGVESNKFVMMRLQRAGFPAELTGGYLIDPNMGQHASGDDLPAPELKMRKDALKESMEPASTEVNPEDLF